MRRLHETFRLPMIITCPECDTHYTVKDEAFKAPGRKVRCKNCGNQWFQEPPGDAATPAPVEAEPEDDVEDAPAAEQAAEAAAEPAPEPAISSEADPAASEEPAGSAGEAAAAAPVAEEPVARAVRRPAAKPSRRGMFLGWGLLIAFVVAFFGSLIAFRGNVAEYWPSTASFYDLIGLPVAVQHMEFRKVSYERSMENGLPVLSVRGEIVNVTDDRGPVPRVRVALRDQNGQELYHYFFAIPEGELDGGAVAEFVTRLSSPPDAARDLVLRFVEPGEFEDADPVASASDGAGAP
jgi:predicted Zn finger-like uncharacterized protein